MKLNKKVIAGIGLGAVALIGGTFAYYNEAVSLDNLLRTGVYDNELVEDFTPPVDGVKPGATFSKIVGAQNTGTYPVMVRIKMEEKWQRADENGNITEIISHSSTDGTSPENRGQAFLTIEKSDDGLFTATQGGDADGLVAGDYTVVAKNFSSTVARYENDVTANTNWIFNASDGYWYYNGILDSKQSTGNILESLTIATNIDLGHYIEKDYYYVGAPGLTKEDITADQWKEYKINKDAAGEIESIIVGETEITKATEKTLGNNDGMVNAIDLAKVVGANGKSNTLYRKNESLMDDNKGYADANYILTVTSQFVQATPDALIDAFGADNGSGQKVIEGHLPSQIVTIINSIDLDATSSNASQSN